MMTNQNIYGASTRARKSESIPFIFWVVIGFTLLSSLVFGNVFGFNISGLSWFIPLMVASLILVQRSGRVSFPLWIWLPWVLLLIMNLVVTDSALLDPRVSPIQRTVQLLTPLVVGMAISTYRPSYELLDRCVQVLIKFSYLLFAGSVLGSLAAILVGQRTGLAMQVMTGMLMAIFFINRYLIFQKVRDMKLYLIMASLPVLAITRTVMAVILLAVPLSFGPMSLKKRITFIGLVVFIAILLFYLPQIQEKMFYSGHGEWSDISLDNEDFATTGRSFMWTMLLEYGGSAPWLGHGTGASETFVYRLTGLAYPHNDWLLTYFDYGRLGVIVYLLCNITMLLHCWKSSTKSNAPVVKLFFLAGASSFIPFMMVMFTDNIMVYASFFGNLQYLIIGLAYGALSYEREAQVNTNNRLNQNLE